MASNPATDATKRAIGAFCEHLPFSDRRDFADAERGFIAALEDRYIKAADGRVVWDMEAYSFLEAECPDTANPSLWRQSQLNIKSGLFEVVPGIYQLRGFDLSVMTVVEGKTGLIVIDPLISKETAAAAFGLYVKHRGTKPVVAMVYTHSHVDHFGGVKGIISEDDVSSGRCQVIAPAGFMEHAVSENIYAGPAMTRRAGYMYGAALDKGPCGSIGSGLGQTTSTGEPTLIKPTVDITHTGQEMEIDGVRMVFQMTPGTEAPAEMNFYFPDHKACCTAENATHTLHNILTIRGAVVRDAHAWGHYLNETIDLWGDEMEVCFASHHWPTWGNKNCLEFLSVQRDVYLYLHDQTLRMINQGYVGSEIAEVLKVPPQLEAAWHAHGYYGTFSHNIKAVYQRYMGWYEGNPARLWPHPPEDSAKRYVKAMGGVEKAVEVAREAYEEGDYRWAAQVLDHVLFSNPNHPGARELQANTFEQLGYYAESGTWRSAYLAGAHELRKGNFGTPAGGSIPDFLKAITVSQLLDSIAIRIDGPKAWDEKLLMSWAITDEDKVYVAELRNGVLNHKTAAKPAAGSTIFTLSKAVLTGILTRQIEFPKAVAEGLVKVEGDPGVLRRLVAVLAESDPNFSIVTP
ncbi:alkyl/aryl-sulfatase BDS1 bacterially-derived sulfatase 1 [Hyaloraphidium curvatum]|nr:alkyl/aryl-sulfatase BDS1 bacterially-derived sulfatase 1 [Hyaloraphidium curvatum]